MPRPLDRSMNGLRQAQMTISLVLIFLVRGPCPMLNTLANHGFLPHDGKNLTQEVVTKGLGDGLNFAPALTQIMFKQALPANPDYPNATAFNLDQLNRHNVLEHDASLSRLDAYNGNNHVFNQRVFDETKKYWTEPIITAEHIANSKLARMLQSKATNPEYRFTNTTESLSIGEILAPFIAFGDAKNATVRRDLTIYFFEHRTAMDYYEAIDFKSALYSSFKQ
ncbi:hypothetical protein BTJ68_06707 [Hortaea werneckii EXF-2000]|uniref:Heme haloperoxidase family profile domain-containing protein n=1 Tax=Hortaea werneckii EXF-2000 TaxID=1157616 RepID=A0A1Z5TE34_HORWE|nr:hypothetical protein BTJ68_06707 [Hortaea werneckii EXF-2000]